MTKQILIVEDEADVAGPLAEVLEAAGYGTQTARNGLEALEHLQRGNHPDLIILDLMMPVLDGWGFRREQQLLKDAASIPVVVLTANGDAHRKASAIKAHGYINKPCSIQSLLREVERLCGPAGEEPGAIDGTPGI